MDLHRSYTNVNVTWDKGRIRKFMGVWELENQIKFSIKYSVNSLINAALEQPKHPQKCIRIGLLFAWNLFSTGGLRPPDPPTRALPWTHWGPGRPPDPLPAVLPHCSGLSYAPSNENWFALSTNTVLATKFPTDFNSTLLCFPTNCSKCCNIDTLFFKMCHTLKTRLNTQIPIDTYVFCWPV